MREGKFHKRKRWLWFPGEGGTDAGKAKTIGTWYMTYTKQRDRLSAQTLLDERKRGREKGGRKEDSNRRDLFQGEIMENRAIGMGFLEEERLIQSRRGQVGSAKKGKIDPLPWAGTELVG